MTFQFWNYVLDLSYSFHKYSTEDLLGICPKKTEKRKMNKFGKNLKDSVIKGVYRFEQI